MTINSVLSSGIDGVKRGLETAQNAAQTIADTAITTDSNANIDSSGLPSENTDANGLETLTEAIVDLKVGEHQVKASAAVIKTADEVLGTLVDTKA